MQASTDRLLRAALAAAAFLLVLTAVAFASGQNAPAPAPPASQSFALTDTSALAEMAVNATPVEYRGRKAVRLTSDAPDSAGYATVKGTNFRDGSIDVDVAVVPKEQPGGGSSPGFIGVIFRLGENPSHYEGFYIRPGNSVAEDQARRNHSVQYIAEPHYGWEYLRRNWPFIYESWADLTPQAWTHLRVEVHGRKAKVFLNGSSKPSLMVDGLKGEELQGPIALWGFSGEDSYFANLKIENDAPEPIQNGGEVAGTWDLQFMTDAGGFPSTLKLVRQDGSVSGFYTGPMGPSQPVWGTWRDDYVELNFGGLWPDQAGTVTATLAGWVDGDKAGGRVRVEGRADGRWMATRQK
jgi:hypothetical protein